jgi:transposase
MRGRRYRIMHNPLPPITERPEQLQTLLKQERNAHKRQRLQALYLLASGQAHSRLTLAQLLAVHRHTIGAWLARYATGGLAALLTLKKAPGKAPACSPAVLTQLQARLQQPQGFASYGEIQQYLAHEHHVALAYSSVHGLVRYKLGAKPKSPRRAHPQKSLTRSPGFSRR